MTYYVHSFKFTGANSEVVTRQYRYEVTEIVTGDQIAGVVVDHTTLRVALNAVSDAVINESAISMKVTQEVDPGAGDVFEQAALVVDLDAPDPDKKAILSFPAPSIGVFVAATGENRDIIDVNDADIQGLMTELRKYEWSDGELIDGATPVGGLLKGYRRVSSFRGGQ